MKIRNKVKVKRCNCFQSIVNLGELPTSRGASQTWGVTGGSRVTVINRNAVCSEGKYNNQLSHVVNCNPLFYLISLIT